MGNSWDDWMGGGWDGDPRRPSLSPVSECNLGNTDRPSGKRVEVVGSRDDAGRDVRSWTILFIP